MEAFPVLADIEGDIVRLNGPGGPHLARRLPADKVWEVFDPRDLMNLPGVSNVETNAADNVYIIHYGPALRLPGLDGLRALLRVEEPFGLWRLATAGAALA